MNTLPPPAPDFSLSVSPVSASAGLGNVTSAVIIQEGWACLWNCAPEVCNNLHLGASALKWVSLRFGWLRPR
jgi:hypothetical protein